MQTAWSGICVGMVHAGPACTLPRMQTAWSGICVGIRWNLEKRRGGRASHHEACEAIGAFLLLCAATGVSLLAVWCLSGATPRGSAVDVCSDAPARGLEAG